MLDKFTQLVELILEGKYHPLDKDKEPIKISDRFSIIAGKNVSDKKWRIPYITQSKDLDGAYIYTAYSNSGVKGDDRKDYNRYQRPYQVPSQFLEMVQKGHLFSLFLDLIQWHLLLLRFRL